MCVISRTRSTLFFDGSMVVLHLLSLSITFVNDSKLCTFCFIWLLLALGCMLARLEFHFESVLDPGVLSPTILLKIYLKFHFGTLCLPKVIWAGGDGECLLAAVN